MNCPPYGLLSPVSRVGISQPGGKGPIALCPGGLHLGEGVEGSVRGCVRDSFAGEGWVGCRADNCGRGRQRVQVLCSGSSTMDWIEQALVSLCQPSLTFYSDRIGTAQRAPFSDRRWRNATFMSVSPHCVGRTGNFFHIFFFFCLFLSVCVSIFLDVDGW